MEFKRLTSKRLTTPAVNKITEKNPVDHGACFIQNVLFDVQPCFKTNL